MPCSAVARHCPALLWLFILFYGLDSMCFIVVDGEVRVIWSMEGSRMGCTMGSFGFDLVVHDVYTAVTTAYKHLKTKALTDDFNIATPPPDVTDEKEVEEMWTQLGGALVLLKEEARARAGLELNFSKCHILIPAGIPDPPPGIIPDGVSLERNGLRLSGTPIGTATCRLLRQVHEGTGARHSAKA